MSIWNIWYFEINLNDINFYNLLLSLYFKKFLLYIPKIWEIYFKDYIILV